MPLKREVHFTKLPLLSGFSNVTGDTGVDVLSVCNCDNKRANWSSVIVMFAMVAGFLGRPRFFVAFSFGDDDIHFQETCLQHLSQKLL